MSTNRKRPSIFRVVIIALFAVALFGKWYAYVAHAATPFEDVGSSINAIMPAPINKVGCDMLRKRFNDIPVAPRGCNGEGRWI